MRTLLAGLAVAALLTCLLGLASAAPESVALELKGEPGQEMKYDTTLDLQMHIEVRNPETTEQIFTLNPRASGSLVSIARITEVADNGDLTFEGRIESFAVTMDFADLHMDLSLQGPRGGPPQLIKLPPLPIHTVVSKRGEPLALKGLEKIPIPLVPGPEGQQIDIRKMIEAMLDTFARPLFPERPVSVGDSWTTEVVFDLAKMIEKMGLQVPPEATGLVSYARVPMSMTHTLAGFEMVGDVACAKVVTESSWQIAMPLKPGIMLRGGADTVQTTWLDYAAGQKVKDLFELTSQMRVGTPQLAIAQMELNLRAESKMR